MRLHFLVEGPADVSLLENLLPRLIPGHAWEIYPHQGRGKLPGDPDAKVDSSRRGLLDNLPMKLRAWGEVLDSSTDRVVVLLDVDRDDCSGLLNRLKRMQQALASCPVTIFRLAIEESESWYLGDRVAIREAFPKANLRKLGDWVPDSRVGSWELFMQVIGAPSDDKVNWGESMGKTLRVNEPLEKANVSPSFVKFCRRVRELAGEHAPAAKRSTRSAAASGP